MITTDGKNLIAKYLLNQAPEFASHIAIGVGGNTISTSSSVTFSSSAQCLNFEVDRLPIISKGLIKENGIEKIVLKADLPTNKRYQITEMALYPAATNLVAQEYGSKILTSFSNLGTWAYWQNGSTNLSIVNYGEISASTTGDITQTSVATASAIAFVNNDSQIFEFSTRKNRNEPMRYLNKSLMVLGNSASLDASFNNSASSSYIDYVQGFDMSKNLTTDQIKLAFSTLSLDGSTSGDTSPTNVRIKLIFINDVPGTPSASVGMSVSSADLTGKRYQVVTKQLSDFVKSSADFSWANISRTRIYVSVDAASPANYYVALDGLRLENVSTSNPLYAMVAADYLKSDDLYPALKKENSISSIEYRFGLGT